MKAFGSILLSALTVFCASSILADNASKIEVIKAQYGAESTWSDVTAKVVADQSGDKISTEASNDKFGDPLEGTAKELKVTVKYNDKFYTVKTGEGSKLEITGEKLSKMIPDANPTSKAAPVKVTIIKAEYGADSTWKDVTEKVQSAVSDGAAGITASNENFGDPVEGTAKSLKVKYSIDGKEVSKTVGEGENVTF